LPGVNLKLAAISPTLFREGPAHERRKDDTFEDGKTPMLDGAEWCLLMTSIPVDTVKDRIHPVNTAVTVRRLGAPPFVEAASSRGGGRN